MPYTQNWGISRNALQSPLNNKKPTESEIKWGYMGPDGWVDGTEYTDPESEYNTEGAGTPSFTEEELNLASKISENKKSQAMLKGGEEWENSEYNTQPKKGYDHQGNVMKLHEGDKVTLGGKDVTESHNRKLSGEMSTEDQLDNLQGALGVGGFTPGYGLLADGTNALISGGRGIASMFGVGDKSASDHFNEGVKSAFYAVPILGDAAAVGKANKYVKAINDFNRGTTQVRRTYSKTGKYAQPIVGNLKNWESKATNLLRGGTNWLMNKNKYNKIGTFANTMFGKNFGGVVGAATSSKGLVKGDKAMDTISSYANPIAEETKRQAGDFGEAYANMVSPQKAQSNVDVASTEPKEATNIIEKNVSSTTKT
jgi:hypothetical protein